MAGKGGGKVTMGGKQEGQGNQEGKEGALCANVTFITFIIHNRTVL